MDKPNSSITAKKTELICFGSALKKIETVQEDYSPFDGRQVFENRGEDRKVKSNRLLAGETSPLETEVLEKEIQTSLEITESENKDELESNEMPSKLKPTVAMTEVERLEIQKELLENKLEEIKQQLITKGRVKKKGKDSCLLQIKNMERKVEMLEKRISYEKRMTNLPLSRWKNVKTIAIGTKQLYVNSLRSNEVLARKMKSERQDGWPSKKESPNKLRAEDLSKDQALEVKKERNLKKWKNRWRQLVFQEDSDGEELNVFGVVIKKPKATTIFFPPIPDPMAKKRPKDARLDTKRNSSETRIRLIPNNKRVLQKRASMYEKQLEFAKKYGLETSDIIDNLNSTVISHQQEVPERMATSVTRKQLYLMGALSEEYLHDNDRFD
jgi:hypothetical protein